MRVLVTGASGFIGSHVAEALAQAGHELTLGLRATSDARWVAGLRARRVDLDLAASTGLAAAVRDCDVVVHAGGLTRARRSRDYQRVNAEGTHALLRAAVEAGVRQAVLISSLAARGPDGAPGPVGAYGRSKLAAETLAHGLAASLPVVALRVAGVYGPRDTELLPLFRLARRGLLLLPPRGGRLQPLHVEDLAALVVRLVERPATFGPWPVAGRDSYRWDEVVDHMAAAVGRPLRAAHVPAGVFLAAAAASEAVGALRRRAPAFDRRRALDLACHAYTCDVDATEATTRWRARIPLREGLVRTAAWYQGQGWL